MRDFVVLVFLVGCIYAALKKPWLGVLSLAVFSYLNPHAYAWGFVRSLPVYYVLFLVVCFRTLTAKDKDRLPKDWRITVFILLWLYFAITSTQAYFPDIAWQRFWFVTKIYLESTQKLITQKFKSPFVINFSGDVTFFFIILNNNLKNMLVQR